MSFPDVWPAAVLAQSGGGGSGPGVDPDEGGGPGPGGPGPGVSMPIVFFPFSMESVKAVVTSGGVLMMAAWVPVMIGFVLIKRLIDNLGATVAGSDIASRARGNHISWKTVNEVKRMSQRQRATVYRQLRKRGKGGEARALRRSTRYRGRGQSF